MATLRLAPIQKIINLNDSFAIRVILDTENESVNAYEGTITFPTGLLELSSVDTKDSMIPYWVQFPQATNGDIHFTGMTPGGYKGDNGLFFTLQFKTNIAGEGTLDLKDVTILKNDGLGTEAFVTPYDSMITIHDKTTTVPRSVIEPTDRVPPEHFIPELAQSQVMFDGKWFLSFIAQDKGAGINHYEVRELRGTLFGNFSRWQTATSPYVLSDQSLSSAIEVKAVDNAGNERIERILPAQGTVANGQVFAFAALLALLILAAGILVMTLWKRSRKK